MITKTQPNQSRPWKNILLTLSVACSLTLPLRAVPSTVLPSTASTNLTVINGTATNSTTGTVLTITATDKTVLSWTNFWDNTTGGGFSAAGDVINYVLPSASSAVLNQVTGGSATQINGEITSNGKVFIVNTTGVTIGATGVINAATFGASTVAEPLSYFETNGTLAAFGNGLTGASNGITVTNGASITTIGGSGNVLLAGNTINLDASITGNASLYGEGGVVNVADLNPVTIVATPTGSTSVGGNLTINSQGGSVQFGATASTTVQGNLAITTNGQFARLANVGSTTVNGNLTVATNGGTIRVANGVGNLTVLGNVTLDASGTTANGVVDQPGTGQFLANTTGTTTLINTATETTAGSASTGNPAATVAPGSITLANADFASLSVIGGTTVISDSTTNTLNLGTANVLGSYSATSTGGSIVGTGAIVATTGVSLSTATVANKGITYTGTGDVSFNALTVNSTGGFVKITTTGNVTLPGATIPTLTVTTTGGNIKEKGVINSATADTFNASGSIALDTFVNNLNGKTILIGGANGIYLDNAGALVIGGGTATTGSTQITSNGTIAFGATAGDVVSFGGSLGLDVSANTGHPITTTATTLTVAGQIGIIGGGNDVTLGTAGGTDSFGAIAGKTLNSLVINESATTNLGGSLVFAGSSTAAVTGYATVAPLTTVTGLTDAGLLTVNTTGNIVNSSGVVSVSGVTTLTAGTTSAAGTITIGSTSSLANFAGGLTEAEGSALTLTTSSPIAILSGTSALGYGSLSATVIQTTPAAGSPALSVDATLGATVGYSTISFNTNGGNVAIGQNIADTPNPVALTLTNAVMAKDASTFAVTDGSSLTLGSGISLSNTLGNTVVAKGIADSAGSSFYMTSNTSFSSSAGINLANGPSNSVGTVTLALTGTSNNGSIAYKEGSTVKLAGVSTADTTSTGTVSISSVSGDILQTAAISLPTTVTGVSFSAPGGAVTLTQANVIGTVAASTAAGVPISITALNASALTDGANVLLGTTQVSHGGLTVDASGTAGDTITQAAGTAVYVWGNPTFNTQGAAITLANAGNNFGAITANTVNGAAAGAAVSIRESGTTNYAGVNTGTGATSSWTAVSDTGDVIETGAAIINVGGATSLTASAGSIILGNATSGVFPVTTGHNTFGGSNGIFAKASGNVTLADGNAVSTVLVDSTGGANFTVGGNLTVTNTSGTATIMDTGNAATLAVTGNAVFASAGTGGLNLQGTNSSFGAVGFNLGSAGSTFTENATTNLLAGSLVTGSMTINSGGNIITSGSGSSTYQGTLRLNATGSIVISGINTPNTLIVDAVGGPTNLSGESKTNNLTGTPAVTNLGNATNYTGPNP